MICAECGKEIVAAYWRQLTPTVRDVCLECGNEDDEARVIGADGAVYLADYSAIPLE